MNHFCKNILFLTDGACEFMKNKNTWRICNYISFVLNWVTFFAISHRFQYCVTHFQVSYKRAVVEIYSIRNLQVLDRYVLKLFWPYTALQKSWTCSPRPARIVIKFKNSARTLTGHTKFLQLCFIKSNNIFLLGILNNFCKLNSAHFKLWFRIHPFVDFIKSSMCGTKFPWFCFLSSSRSGV